MNNSHFISLYNLSPKHYNGLSLLMITVGIYFLISVDKQAHQQNFSNLQVKFFSLLSAPLKSSGDVRKQTGMYTT